MSQAPTDQAEANLPELTKDGFLQDLVALNTRIDGEMPITLQVSGMLVSGLMISYTKYFEGIAEVMTTWVESPDSKEVMRKHIAGYGEPPPPQDELRVPFSFIHLRDARFFIPGADPIPTSSGVLWRGLISAVSGFTLGTLSHDRLTGVRQ